MKEDEEPNDKFQFPPLGRFLGGYHLQGITKTLAQLLEDCKVEHLEDRGYSMNGNDGYDAGCTRTSRKIIEDAGSGT